VTRKVCQVGNPVIQKKLQEFVTTLPGKAPSNYLPVEDCLSKVHFSHLLDLAHAIMPRVTEEMQTLQPASF